MFYVNVFSNFFFWSCGYDEYLHYQCRCYEISNIFDYEMIDLHIQTNENFIFPKIKKWNDMSMYKWFFQLLIEIIRENSSWYLMTTRKIKILMTGTIFSQYNHFHYIDKSKLFRNLCFYDINMQNDEIESSFLRYVRIKRIHFIE